MREVLEAPRLMVEFQQKARQRAVSLFGEERMVAEHFAVYEQVLSRR